MTHFACWPWRKQASSATSSEPGSTCSVPRQRSSRHTAATHHRCCSRPPNAWARETGALGELPLALSQRVYVHLFAGELAAAASLVEEIQSAAQATGSSLAPYGAVGLLALRGQEAEAISLIDRVRIEVSLRGEG